MEDVLKAFSAVEKLSLDLVPRDRNPLILVDDVLFKFKPWQIVILTLAIWIAVRLTVRTVKCILSKIIIHFGSPSC